jgi:hypothetical protein
MGASGWEYFVPYEVDISAALQRLREDVFRRGDYVSGHGLSQDEFETRLNRLLPAYESLMKAALAEADDTSLPEDLRAAQQVVAEQMRKELEKYRAGDPQPEQRPTSIDALLAQQAESGTHSILDITCISQKPKSGAISPFPVSKLSEFFGSDSPSRAQIQHAYESGALDKFVSKRWQGVYVIAYRNGFPAEIFFAGCSGD